MAFNEDIDFWNNQTVADGQAMSAPLEKLLENDNYLKNKSDENEPKVFFAEYEITTFEEVTNALAANKMVFLRKIITVSEENHVIYLPLSNKKTSEPNVYTFSGISGHSGNLVISFTLSENDIWSFGNDSPFPSKQIQVVAYGSTSLSDINSYFNKCLYLVCNRGGEYLPLIRRSLNNDSYEYIFSGCYENKIVKLKCDVSGWSEEVISSTQIKDNAYDDQTDPVDPDNITDVERLTFFRNVGVDANYTMVESEKGTYGVLIPPPSMQADHGKVPMYKNGNQIAWEAIIGIPDAPDDGLSYARTSNAWNAISSPIDITDDFELINGMSTNDVGHFNRLRVIYVPSTDMVQITGNLFSPSSKPYDSWVPCMKYTGDFLSFNSVKGGNMNMGLGEPPIYSSVRAIMSSAFIGDENYTDKIFAFKGLIGHNNLPFYGVSANLTCYGCRAAKLAEIAAAELANSGE